MALTWKAQAEALTPESWDCLAMLAREKIPGDRMPSYICSIPTGGDPFAEAFRRLHGPLDPQGPALVLDDCLTTGASMELGRENMRDLGYVDDRIIGIVAFARGDCPDWVKPIWRLLSLQRHLAGM